MEKKLCKKSHPTSALKLYMKLYCKRRNSSKSKMMEAIKSWVCLSKTEREQFITKFKECQENNKKKLADYLSKTQPFLKKKHQSKAIMAHRDAIAKKENNTIEIDTEVNVEPIDDFETLHKSNSLHKLDDDKPLHDDVDMSKQHCEFSELAKSPSHNNSGLYGEEPLACILAEPAPPSLKCAKDLFVMIKSRNGETADTWSLLPSSQKRRYQKAVSMLKEDYIRKFKVYLESLPSKQLFNYYNNYFN